MARLSVAFLAVPGEQLALQMVQAAAQWVAGMAPQVWPSGLPGRRQTPLDVPPAGPGRLGAVRPGPGTGDGIAGRRVVVVPAADVLLEHPADRQQRPEFTRRYEGHQQRGDQNTGHREHAESRGRDPAPPGLSPGDVHYALPRLTRRDRAIGGSYARPPSRDITA